jgi:hypothetical protein
MKENIFNLLVKKNSWIYGWLNLKFFFEKIDCLR